MEGLVGKMATSARAWAARLSPVQFAKKQDGTVTAFAVLIFVLMVGASGIAIDVMRYETQRTQLQYTLDRAILAAASLTQPYDPEGVVRNYFDISGIENYRLDVRVDEGLNFRRVHAYAELEVRSMFMSLFGVHVMTSPAIGAAEERVRNIEVSMVLDISGSMGSNNRMTNMRPAAREFVTEVLSANATLNAENLVTVSIVPYNGRVNSGAMIDSVFTFDGTQAASNCARFDAAPNNYSFDPSNGWSSWTASSWAASDFTNTAIDPAVPIARIAHWDRNNESSDQFFQSPHCQTDGYAEILPWQHEETVLHTHINSLNTGGWTAIDLGMNWAVGLLDPTANTAVQALIASGDVHPDFDDRPAPFVDGDDSTLLDDETIKVVVMMTDGANTNQYDIRDEYYRLNGGPRPSVIFTYDSDDDDLFEPWPGPDRVSIWLEDRRQFWIPQGDPRSGAGYWADAPFAGYTEYPVTNRQWRDPDENGTENDGLDARVIAYAEATAQAIANGDEYLGWSVSWPYLWDNYTREWIAEEWLERAARADGRWAYHDAFIANSSHLYVSQNDTPIPADRNLRAICDAANSAGIIIYAIAFEAPDRGQDVMQYCATTDATYYDVEGLEISEAFENIARSINQLRLIQ
ncbi:pilus assembly protein TadG-related protein [Gymnodinialimonas ulvae]|uniref:pilus assembly protein TadG-related protein n=1 Tax=Gymnodinialimonas ulvae TaxID=3126504 RepID=UPI0030A8EC01